jgi:hypothetical protein
MVHSERGFEGFGTPKNEWIGESDACLSSKSGSELFGMLIFAKIEQMKVGKLYA